MQTLAQFVWLINIFPFDATNEAWAYVESGRAKGKVVIKVR